MKIFMALVCLFLTFTSKAQQTFFNQKIAANQIAANDKVQDALAANYISTQYSREENFMPSRNFKLKLTQDFPLAIEEIKWQTYSNNSLSFIGKITTQPNSSVVLSKYGNRWNGMISTEDHKKYILQQTSDVLYAISEINEQSYSAQDVLSDQILPTPEGTTANYNVCDVANPCTANPVTINILIVYTPAAAVTYGGTAATIANLTTAVTNMNVANTNSGVNANVVFNLAQAVEVNYIESGNTNTDLVALRTNNDGIMDEVHSLRTIYQADLVSLIVATPTSTCGLGYVQNNPTNYSASFAFNVVVANCVVGNLSMAHELGHNMGLQHDWYVDVNNFPCEHHHGYVNQAAFVTGAPTNKRWRTILAYNNECSDAGFNCTRLNYWSNPAILRTGDPMGINIGNPEPSNEVYGINRFACVVASFVGAAVLPLHFTGLQAQYQNNKLMVKWQTADENNVAHYEVEVAENIPQNFTTIRQAAAQNRTQNNYVENINKLIANNIFVRIKAKDNDGKITYSNIVAITINRTATDFAYLKTNSVTNQLDVYFNNPGSKLVAVKILSFDGKLLQKAGFQTAPGFSTHQININHLPRGFYLVNVGNGSSYTNFKIFKD